MERNSISLSIVAAHIVTEDLETGLSEIQYLVEKLDTALALGDFNEDLTHTEAWSTRNKAKILATSLQHVIRLSRELDKQYT